MKQTSAADKVPFTKVNSKRLLFQIDKKLYKNINNLHGNTSLFAKYKSGRSVQNCF